MNLATCVLYYNNQVRNSILLYCGRTSISSVGIQVFCGFNYTHHELNIILGSVGYDNTHKPHRCGNI